MPIGVVTIIVVGTIAIFSIPIIAILTDASRRKAKLQLQIVEKEIELEKLKNENFLIETEKMKVELEKLKLENPLEDSKFLSK
ncbi:hypothetical protein [Metabacillus fastidiosus]|uniref:hypothetical protein n=1 Tax=Metabacillus fastidiosus TaxID=1458 RepID=UPI003D29BF72